jgi:Fur family peroxide stress response transcriptional regulator
MAMEEKRSLPRVTRQRKAIFSALQGDISHPTAEEVYQKVKHQMPQISLATVYRNLKLLAEESLILELTTPDGPNRYDFQTHDHYHFVCDRCERVEDVAIPVQTHLNHALTAMGYVVRSHETIFEGLCRQCSTRSNA